MPRLRSFVYISTFYTNNFKPYNTPVPEVVHHPTLQLTGEGDALLQLSKHFADDLADIKCSVLCHHCHNASSSTTNSTNNSDNGTPHEACPPAAAATTRSTAAHTHTRLKQHNPVSST
jgi:hypothetical protein